MTAPVVLDGPKTRAWFLAYVEQVVCPTLRTGAVGILDNLPAHKRSSGRIRLIDRERVAPALATCASWDDRIDA